MLILTRCVGESVVIEDEVTGRTITVLVSANDRGQVKLGFDSPKSDGFRFTRSELMGRNDRRSSDVGQE